MYYGNLLRKQIDNERKKKRLVVYTFFSLILVYICANLFFDDMGVVKFLYLKKTEKKLLHEISALETENSSIQHEIKLLKSKLFYIEKHAREDLNLAGSDEYIFLYEK